MELQYEVKDWLGVRGWVNVKGDELGQEEVRTKEVGGEEEGPEEVGEMEDAGGVEDAGVN